MNTRKILLVDDEQPILNALKRLLHRKGYQIYTAINGRAALDILKSTPVHLIITDYRMPEMNGGQLLEVITRSYPTIRRILLTGYSSLKDAEVFVQDGLSDMLIRKPWDDSDLVSCISNLLTLDSEEVNRDP